jgi:heat shock protein HtpX
MTTFTNNLKTTVLMTALIGLIGWVGWMIGSFSGLFIAGAIAVSINLVIWYFADRIAITTMRGREADALSSPELIALVRRLSERAGIPMPRVFICPQEASNAFATGRNPDHAAVAVTRGALRLLDQEELEGVMAHEIAHIKNRDTMTSTIAGIFSILAQWAFFFGLSGGRESHPITAFIVIMFGAVGAALIKAMISRSREYVADADGARIAGSSEGLISALWKLEASSRQVPMENPNPAMNSLFIVEPFSGGVLTRLFSTHPPTDQRVSALISER